MTDLARLQRKWDSHLIIKFFEQPDLPVWKAYGCFCRKENIDAMDNQLLRTPAKSGAYIYGSCDIYQFVSTRLRKIYKYIENKDVTDIFSILDAVTKSGIDTAGQEKELKGLRDLKRSVKEEELKKMVANYEYGYLKHGTSRSSALRIKTHMVRG